jgi:hypothetical protein
MKVKQEDAETATLGRTFIRDADQANAFSKLSRYKTAIERSLYNALYTSFSVSKPPATPRFHYRSVCLHPPCEILATASAKTLTPSQEAGILG